MINPKENGNEKVVEQQKSSQYFFDRIALYNFSHRFLINKAGMSYKLNLAEVQSYRLSRLRWELVNAVIRIQVEDEEDGDLEVKFDGHLRMYSKSLFSFFKILLCARRIPLTSSAR